MYRECESKVNVYRDSYCIINYEYENEGPDCVLRMEPNPYEVGSIGTARWQLNTNDRVAWRVPIKPRL